MPVNVIGTLKPKNNGKFPVAEAVDIKVTDNLRLDEALENKADLDTLNYALANKADKTTTTALQSQLDEIAHSQGAGTADTEIAQARVGTDGTTYSSLKNRLDTENNNTYKVFYGDEKTFSLSDVESDGVSMYYFLNFGMKAGKKYIVEFDKRVTLFLRAEKMTRPSIQTVGDVNANVPVTFTANADLNWLVIYSPGLQPDETFTCKIKPYDELDSYIPDIVESKERLNQFIEISDMHLSGNIFTIGGIAAYNGAINTAQNRATIANKIITFDEVTDITIFPDSNVKHYIFSEEHPSGGTGWITTPFTFEKGKSYSYVIAYSDDRNISDIDDLCAHFNIYDEFILKVIQIDEALSIVKDSGLGTEYPNKKISILGDSISTFGGSASDDPSERISDGTYTYAGNRCRYPQTNLLTDVNNTYWKKLIDDFGLVLGINESWAGSRVSWDGTTESADIGANKHIASATRIGHLGENGTPDIILINGGTNDIGGNVPVGTFNTENPMNYTDEQIAELPVSTFADAYRTMLIRLQKSYPTSRIFVLLPNYTTSYYTPTKADEYCEVIKEACDYFGIKWLDMRASGITMFNRGAYLPDGIHYNANGMNVVAKNVKKFMQYNFTV